MINAFQMSGQKKYPKSFRINLVNKNWLLSQPLNVKVCVKPIYLF